MIEVSRTNVTIGLFLILISSACAFDERMLIEGELRNNSNQQLLNGTYANVNVSFTENSDGSNPTWSELQTLTVLNGSFVIKISNATGLNFTSKNYYYCLMIGTEQACWEQGGVPLAFEALRYYGSISLAQILGLNEPTIVRMGNANKTLSSYHNITDLPTCAGTDKLTYDGSTLSCDTDESNVDTDTNDTIAVTALQSFKTNATSADCPDGNYSYGQYSNGTYKCRNDIQGGSSSTQLTFLNVTTGTYTGNITNGSLNGYAAAHAICNATFTGTRLCSMSDITNYLAYNSFSVLGGNDTWASQGGAKYVPADVPVNDCLGFTWGTAGTYLGNYFHFHATNGGDARALNCGTSLKLACCK